MNNKMNVRPHNQLFVTNKMKICIIAAAILIIGSIVLITVMKQQKISSARFFVRSFFLDIESIGESPQKLSETKILENGLKEVTVETKNQYYQLADLKVSVFQNEEAAEINKFLSSSELIECNNPEIISLANQFSDSEMISDIVADSLKWISQNISYNEELAKNKLLLGDWSAAATLKNRSGTCSEMSSLYIAIMRNHNIPAKYVYGKLFEITPKGPGKYISDHVWIEIYLHSTNQWIPIDPTVGTIGIGKGYLKLLTGVDGKSLKEGINPLEVTYYITPIKID